MNNEAALQARFASTPRRARSRKLTVPATTVVLTLGPGGWRLYGHATQLVYQTRSAAKDGTLLTGEAGAPTDAAMVVSSAGTPAANKAYGNGFATGDPASDAEAGGSVVGALPLPVDPTLFEEIAVPGSGFVNLYLRSTGAAATPILQGPYE